MTAIWQNDGTGWQLAAPSGFPTEADLHHLVEQAPHILPLAGGPRLVVIGREVLLGGNWADLIAVEPSGRVVIVEIKLAKNAEARRAVVAQILTYAAYLRGMTPTTFEHDILRAHLQKRGYDDLAQAVIADDQEGAFDGETFATTLATSLREGRFRLVLVLDTAPPELIRLVGYLGAVSDRLVIDLVTVAAYEIGSSQLVVPQRVDAEREPEAAIVAPKSSTKPLGYTVEGKEAFIETIDQAPSDQQPSLQRLVDWAAALEAEGLAKLWTYRGTSRATLLPYVMSESAGLVTVWNDNGASLSFWRSVFERLAPATLSAMEQSSDMPKIGKGSSTKTITEALLTYLTQAYREAAARPMPLQQLPEA